MQSLDVRFRTVLGNFRLVLTVSVTGDEGRYTVDMVSVVECRYRSRLVELSSWREDRLINAFLDEHTIRGRAIGKLESDCELDDILDAIGI